MSANTIFLAASLLGLISLPRILVALAKNTLPRRWLMTLGICTLVILFLIWLKPGVYTWDYLAQLVIEAVASILN